MRKLILFSSDLYLRSFLETGAFAEVEDPETNYAASEEVHRLEALSRKPGFYGVLPLPPKRERQLDRFRYVAMAAMRERSETMRIKTEVNLGRVQRPAIKAAASPGLRRLSRRYLLGKAGENLAMREMISRTKPDLVIAPTAGTDSPVWDAIVEARRVGARSLVLVNGWDNVSSKAAFPELPDYIGVWGPLAADHAVLIHGIPRERIFEIGAPTFEQHFAHDPASHDSPYEWPYVLFAGCALPFDELDALRRLERAVRESNRPELRIVYRPHPWRLPRSCPDAFDPTDFERVVLDRQLERGYSLSQERGMVGPDALLPELDYYPALLANAELVVCAPTTMIIEALILRKRVLALAYDDEVHTLAPSVVARFSHFDGLESTDGVHLCADRDRVPERFQDVLAASDPPSQEGIRKWLHFADEPYSARLRRVVDAIGGRPAEADPALIAD